MPRFSKYNDAVRYDQRLKSQTYVAKEFNNLIDAIKATTGYRMITWDTFGINIMNKEALVKTYLDGE